MTPTRTSLTSDRDAAFAVFDEVQQQIELGCGRQRRTGFRKRVAHIQAGLEQQAIRPPDVDTRFPAEAASLQAHGVETEEAHGMARGLHVRRYVLAHTRHAAY